MKGHSKKLPDALVASATDFRDRNRAYYEHLLFVNDNKVLNAKHEFNSLFWALNQDDAVVTRLNMAGCSEAEIKAAIDEQQRELDAEKDGACDCVCECVDHETCKCDCDCDCHADSEEESDDSDASESEEESEEEESESEEDDSGSDEEEKDDDTPMIGEGEPLSNWNAYNVTDGVQPAVAELAENRQKRAVAKHGLRARKGKQAAASKPPSQRRSLRIADASGPAGDGDDDDEMGGGGDAGPASAGGGWTSVARSHAIVAERRALDAADARNWNREVEREFRERQRQRQRKGNARVRRRRRGKSGRRRYGSAANPLVGADALAATNVLRKRLGDTPFVPPPSPQPKKRRRKGETKEACLRREAEERVAAELERSLRESPPPPSSDDDL